MTTVKIISAILILITSYFSFRHGWPGITNSMTPEQAKMVGDLGFNKTGVLILSILTLAVGVLVLTPWTFFAGNLLNAFLIVTIMAMALKTNNIKTALIEIPFLLLPLILIYLGHPLKKV